MSASRYSVRVLLALAWPVVLARSAQAVIGFSDASMSAPLGEVALAAVTTGSINAYTLAIFPMGIAFVVQSFASQLSGRGDLVSARRYAWYGLLLSLIFGALAVLAIPLIDPTLALFPFSSAVRAAMTDYLSIRMFAVAGLVGTEALGNWYAGLGDTRPHMIAALLQMALNVLLNWVLIYGNLGAPAMGVAGAAWASVIATWVGFLLLAGLFAARWGYRAQVDRLGLKLREFLRLLRFGVPNGVNWFLEFIAFWLFINLVVADLGTVVLAAMMTVVQINSVAFMPAFGLASAGAVLAGTAIGRDERDEVPAIVRRTALVAACWQGGVGLLYLAIPTTLIAIFEPPTGGSAQFLEVGATLVAVSAAWQLFDALQMTLSEALRAAGDTAWTMWGRLVMAWTLFVPAALVGVRLFDGGPVWAMCSIILYMAALA
ncbi:MAG: MATE family efflux transporter, partial [Nannocystaceae bacterium]